MVMHLARPAGTLGPIQPVTSVHWTLRVAGLYAWRNGHSADTPDKTRTARLQGGQRAGRKELLPPVCFIKSNRF